MSGAADQWVAWPTVIGLGLLLMPLTTMWHEIGGHALACAAQGGHVAAIGAFYVNCSGLADRPDRIVALAGAGVDALLALTVHAVWRRARGDLTRLALWYVWVGKALVAAGYIAFSGVSGFGDLAPGSNAGGGLGAVPYPALWRIGEVAVGIALYVWLIRRAIAALAVMLGNGLATRSARRRIAHGFYVTSGVAAVLVGLLNPMGLTITLLSAAASSLGGLAGLISVGFATRIEGEPRGFVIPPRWTILAGGMAVFAAFALILGPTLRFA